MKTASRTTTWLRVAVVTLGMALLALPGVAQSGTGKGKGTSSKAGKGKGVADAVIVLDKDGYVVPPTPVVTHSGVVVGIPQGVVTGVADGVAEGISVGVVSGVRAGVAVGVGNTITVVDASEWAEPQSAPMTTDEEVKMMALNGLRRASPDEAVPVLDRFLREKHTDRLRERALAVLSGFGNAAARDVVARVARDGSDPRFQVRAIRYLARFEGEETRKILMEIYGSTTNTNVKRTIIRTLGGAQDVASVVSLARGEQESAVRSYAISQLGAMNATVELRELYRTQVDVEARTAAIRALANAREVTALADIARSEQVSVLRREAIRRVSTIDAEEASKALIALYGTEKDTELRKEILRGLSRQRNITALIALARQETDPDLRRYAVARIAESKSKEATEFLAELLSK
ncbi:MAG TPA: HEAT repeat domain-containing protein [Candidatus Acidoferrales bacterium]